VAKPTGFCLENAHKGPFLDKTLRFLK